VILLLVEQPEQDVKPSQLHPGNASIHSLYTLCLWHACVLLPTSAVNLMQYAHHLCRYQSHTGFVDACFGTKDGHHGHVCGRCMRISVSDWPRFKWGSRARDLDIRLCANIPYKARVINWLLPNLSEVDRDKTTFVYRTKLGT
jgi:hypothetical protein